jgi:diguanylate cyclase (GGDEF)-like protein
MPAAISPLTAWSVVLALLASAFLGVSLWRGTRIFRQAREYARTWLVLLSLIGILALGSALYAWLLFSHGAQASDLLLAGMLLVVAAVVGIVNALSCSVVEDFARIAALEQHRSHHDELSGLPKRSFFVTLLECAIANHGANPPKQMAVMMMDLTRFKAINDKMGHAYGDLLLQEVALRLHRTLRRTDLLARMGGDEFGVVIDPVEDPQHIAPIVGHVVAALEEPFAVQGHRADVGMSIGLAWFPDHGRDSATLMRHAKTAMLEAKHRQLDLVIYSEALEGRDRDQLNILSGLRRAVERGELTVHYQPQVELASGRLCGVEALVRWPHSHLGLIAPDDFVPMAEEHGLINLLGDWVIDEVLGQLRHWREMGIKLPISTNISPVSLLDRRFYDALLRGIRARALSPGELKLEITETAVMADSTRVVNMIRELVRSGIRFAIDDFGTGYSSLEYLKTLPVDELKIDKGFVLDLPGNDNDAIIVRSTIDLAHKLGRKVVAEGVESRETLELLSRWGCDRAQGFHIGEPMPADELTARLNRSDPRDLRLTPIN